jgi:hypothetical protein
MPPRGIYNFTNRLLCILGFSVLGSSVLGSSVLGYSVYFGTYNMLHEQLNPMGRLGCTLLSLILNKPMTPFQRMLSRPIVGSDESCDGAVKLVDS